MEKSFVSFEKYHAKPLGKLATFSVYKKQELGLHALIQKHKITKFKRTKNVVSENYDQSAWKKILEGKKWIKFNKIEDFILNYGIMKEKIYSIVKNYTQPDDIVVELGCGWGLNLWSLISLNFPNKLEGYEISVNGLETCKKINSHFKCNVTFGKIDLTNIETFSSLENKFLFTFHVLEQLKYETKEVIENLIKIKPKMVLHFEPVIELYKNNQRDKVLKLYLKALDYQDNLLNTLKDFEKKNKIKILEACRLGFASNPMMESSLIRWVTT